VARRQRPFERAEPSRLTKPLADARAMLDERIAQGDRILASLVPGPLSMDAKSWHDKNEAILERLFTGRSEYEAYRTCILSSPITIGVRGGGSRSNDEKHWHEQRLQSLRRLRDRLDVYDPPAEAPLAPQSTPVESAALKLEVFVVHGHSREAKEEVARVLERLGLKAIILHEQPDTGRVILEKFEHHADVGYAVVVLTPDDECGTTRRARQNVILELGYFFGRLGRGRVLALYKPDVELPSDLDGWLYTLMDDAGAWKFKLGRELRAAGFDVNLNVLA
jgi:predicted nucleotide-binding protein